MSTLKVSASKKTLKIKLVVKSQVVEAKTKTQITTKI
tara:strand:- start:56 stop:166 length:111 start_codon:yes stop_codon:yes gene_type:complete